MTLAHDAYMLRAIELSERAGVIEKTGGVAGLIGAGWAEVGAASWPEPSPCRCLVGQATSPRSGPAQILRTCSSVLAQKILLRGKGLCRLQALFAHSRGGSPCPSAGGCFGAVVVDKATGEVIGEGYNRVVAESDPTWWVIP